MFPAGDRCHHGTIGLHGLIRASGGYPQDDGGEALFVEVVVDLVEAVSREGEHQDERFCAGTAQRVPGIGRNIGGESGPDVGRTVFDFHAPAPLHDIIGLFRPMVMQQEPLARRDLRDADDEPGALRAFTRGQEFPADGAACGDIGILPAFPGQIRLIDDDGSRP